jgi:acetolactate synthase-1/2/3 large subunit
MTIGRPRPAAIIMPQDLMAMECSPHAPREESVPRNTTAANLRNEVSRSVALLANAKRPIILAGGGAVWANVGPEIRDLAMRLNCPVVTSQQGKGIIDERDPLSLGHARSARGRVALAHADAMLAIGCRFTEVMTGFRKMQVPKRLIQIDINPNEIGMNYPAEIGIVADAKNAMQALLAEMPTKSASDWNAVWPEARAAKRPNAEWLIEVLRAELPDDAILFTDASEMAYRMHTDYPAYLPRSFFYPSNYIALGWGFPAAIGAAVAFSQKPTDGHPWASRPVVSFSGDGGFVMTCQELATAARYQLRMIIIVHNDNAYGAIKHLQRLKYDERYRDTDLNNPDFMTLAQAFGIPARRTDDATSFRTALGEALKHHGPFLIEVADRWRYLRH